MSFSYAMKRFVKCFFELLSQNFSVGQEERAQNSTCGRFLTDGIVGTDIERGLFDSLVNQIVAIMTTSKNLW